jgi:hypothetical protein
VTSQFGSPRNSFVVCPDPIVIGPGEKKSVVIEVPLRRLRIHVLSDSSRERGTFVIAQLSAGLHILLVRGPADAGLVPARVEVNAVESAEVPVTAVLKRGGRLRVAVSASGETFAQARIISGTVHLEGPFRDETTRQDVGDQLVSGQRYLFDHGLEPGSYVLRWQRGHLGRSRDGWFRALGSGPKGEIPFTVTARGAEGRRPEARLKGAARAALLWSRCVVLIDHSAGASPASAGGRAGRARARSRDAVSRTA